MRRVGVVLLLIAGIAGVLALLPDVERDPPVPERGDGRTPGPCRLTISLDGPGDPVTKTLPAKAGDEVHFQFD